MDSPFLLLLGLTLCASLDVPLHSFPVPAIPANYTSSAAPDQPYFIPFHWHAARRTKRAPPTTDSSPRFLPKPQYGILFSRKGLLAYDVLTRYVAVSTPIPPYPAYTPFQFTSSPLCTPWISKVPSYYREYEATNFQDLQHFFHKIKTTAHDTAQDSSQSGILRSTCLFHMVANVYAAFVHRVQYENHVATLRTLAGQLPTPLQVLHDQWASIHNGSHYVLHNGSFILRPPPPSRSRRSNDDSPLNECASLNFFSRPRHYRACELALEALVKDTPGASGFGIVDQWADYQRTIQDNNYIQEAELPPWHGLGSRNLAQRLGGYVVYHHREFSSLYDAVYTLANDVSADYSLLNETIQYVNDSMHSIAERVVAQISALTAPVENLYRSQIVQDLFQAHDQFVAFQTTHLFQSQRVVERTFRDFLTAARTHKFTPSLANTTYLLSLLHTLQTAPLPIYQNWQLTLLPNAHQYLRAQHITITNNAFLITGRFPIYYKPEIQPLHTLYDVMTAPLPAKHRPAEHADFQYDYTVLDHVPDILAVSDSTTLQLSKTELQQCIQIYNNYYCPGTFLSFPDHLAPCLTKIFKGQSPQDVSAACSVSYEFAKTPQPTILDGEKFLFLADLHRYPWNLVCGETNRAAPLTPHPFAILQKSYLCKCALTIGPFHFSKLPLACPGVSSLPDFKFQFIPNAFIYGALSNIPDYNLSHFSDDIISHLSDQPLYFGFTPPKVADLLPRDAQGKFLTPPVLKKRLPLNETLLNPHESKTYFHDFSHLIARTHAGLSDLFSHGTTHQKVAMALKIVFGTLFAIALLTAIIYLLRRFALKHPRLRQRQQANHNRRMLNRVVKAAPIVAAGASGGQSAAILTALNVLSQTAQTQANPIPTAPTPAVLDVLPSPTNPAAPLLQTMKMHEIMWTVGFILVFIASTVLFLWKRCQYRSNILPSLFPIFPRSVLHHGICRCDLFLHISSHITGEVLVAHLQPCGLSPFDIFLSEPLTRDRITTDPSCFRPTRVDIDWTGIVLYDKFNRLIPLRNFATASIFTTSDLRELEPSHPYSIQLMGRFLGHCMTVKIKPRVITSDSSPTTDPALPSFTDAPPSYSRT